MKYVLLFLIIHLSMYSFGQVLPPAEDWKYLSNPYLCQYGYVNNEKYLSVHCFSGVSNTHYRVYLHTKTGILEYLPIPDELLEGKITLTSSGPLFFTICTHKGVQYEYHFTDERWIRKTQGFKELQMRGHDDTGPMD